MAQEFEVGWGISAMVNEYIRDGKYQGTLTIKFLKIHAFLNTFINCNKWSHHSGKKKQGKEYKVEKISSVWSINVYAPKNVSFSLPFKNEMSFCFMIRPSPWS